MPSSYKQVFTEIIKNSPIAQLGVGAFRKVRSVLVDQRRSDLVAAKAKSGVNRTHFGEPSPSEASA